MKKLGLVKELAEWAAELRSVLSIDVFSVVLPNSWYKLHKLSEEIQNTADDLLEKVTTNTAFVGDHEEFVNSLLENTPESWDDDVAAESIAVDYVRELEARVIRLGGSLEKYWPEE